ncbi:undecaprenyl-diphosphatase [Nonlabens dokdonensis]|uniref:Undecaprenyl-diphosphatase n=2 Tax=Nonlabens dokdonensis TaxID=328515 RepID=A0ABX5PYZ0_9FLAO|nr:phosphatase PAP2 family protein [Nonlabens dokdonensis]AGC77103.1 putative membrane protein [Nonlabens dokdonensis DSW-6]PZX41062.1 undecaprenyl-diphosphatase [Nonlabens dokdonensis]
MWEQLVEIDQQLFRWINNLWIGKFHSFWLFVTQIQNWFFLYLVFFFLLFKKFEKPTRYLAMVMIPVVVIISLSLTNLVKNGVERLRPNNEPLLMDSIQVLLQPENFSFWSGPSAVSFAVTTFVVHALRSRNATKWIYLFYLWPFTFAFSRIFVGVHYPADITVGMLVGLFLGWISFVLFAKMTRTLHHTA